LISSNLVQHSARTYALIAENSGLGFEHRRIQWDDLNHTNNSGVSSAHIIRMSNADYGNRVEVHRVLCILLALTFSFAATHAQGGDLDIRLFQLLSQNKAANGANTQQDIVVSSPVGPDGCQDRRQECQGWAERGECTINIDFMAPHCKRSCGYCDNTDAECKNSHDSCVGWFIRGECQRNPDFMRYNCKKACKACGPNAIPADYRK
ncbi:unnamed protein product, partial [Meganyctiphanes norvegica]